MLSLAKHGLFRPFARLRVKGAFYSRPFIIRLGS
jgi:hypothetical protein